MKRSTYLILIISVLFFLVLFFFLFLKKPKVSDEENLILTTNGAITVATGKICSSAGFSVKELANEYLESHCCLDHFSLSPKDVISLENSKVIILNGASFEDSLKSHIDNYKNLTIVDSSEGIEVIKDEHRHENPWIWLSVPKYMTQIKNICSKLSEIFPSEREKFDKNSEEYLKGLEKMFENWKLKFAKFSGMKIMVLSNELDYLLDSLDLVPVHLIEGHHHDNSLSANDIEYIKDSIKSENGKFYLISNDNFVKYLDQINDLLGTKYVKLNTLKSNTSSYIDEMNQNFESLLSCCEEFYESEKV